MTTRRHFLQALAALPPVISMSRSWAANADASRLALVIGNGAYRDSPLDNPANDARAMAGLFGQAGFTVDTHLDATRADMIGAIENFGKAIQRSETKLVVFYYAGHGAQLDWRNYLLPVDANVTTADELRRGCVDLNVLLGQLGKTKDKTFVIMVDACRNNPFGRAYRPEQKGLSQFDAPVGSLLAYATSPGNVASDGGGKNGLYTENLVRELSVRGTRIEDALKRVRLNVRLASNGTQIPWETTSLEGDVFIFNDGQKKLSDADLEKQVEADLDEWGRIKASHKIDDWVAYLRKFPNGRFAEIAQVRLNRLLAETEKAALVSVAAAVPLSVKQSPAGLAPETPVQTAAFAAAALQPAIELAPGVQVPQFFQPSANPYSAGSYPLGRKFTLGDEATYRESDILTNVEQRTFSLRVTAIDEGADRVDYNDGKVITDLMGNSIRLPFGEFDAPMQLAPAELLVGRKWTSAYRLKRRNGFRSIGYYDFTIVRREQVRVPAGEFDAFKVEGEGRDKETGHQLKMALWVVPGLNFAVKREDIKRDGYNRYTYTSRIELVSLRQHSLDAACTTRARGMQRNLVIRNNCT